MKPIRYFVFCEKTVFIPLRTLFLECSTYITEHEAVENLQCLETSCPVDFNCMGKLVPRINTIFDQNKNFEVLIAYFKLKGSGRIRAGVFSRDLSEPYLITCNPFALKKFQKEGIIYEWFPNTEFFTNEYTDLIKPESLIR